MGGSMYCPEAGQRGGPEHWRVPWEIQMLVGEAEQRSFRVHLSGCFLGAPGT